jgi:hypothetical protein
MYKMARSSGQEPGTSMEMAAGREDEVEVLAQRPTDHAEDSPSPEAPMSAELEKRAPVSPGEGTIGPARLKVTVPEVVRVLLLPEESAALVDPEESLSVYQAAGENAETRVSKPEDAGPVPMSLVATAENE